MGMLLTSMLLFRADLLVLQLNVFMRKSQQLAIANIAQSVNVISPISASCEADCKRKLIFVRTATKPDGLLKQATFFPFALFSKYMRGIALDVAGQLIQLFDWRS